MNGFRAKTPIKIPPNKNVEVEYALICKSTFPDKPISLLLRFLSSINYPNT